MNFREVTKNSITFLKNKYSDFNYTYDDIQIHQEEIFEKYIYSEKNDILWILEPSMLNLRLERQKGTFILSANIEKKTSDITKEIPPEYLQKIIIPASLTRDVYRLLTSMGIDNSILFTNLDALGNDIYRTLLDSMPNMYIQRTNGS